MQLSHKPQRSWQSQSDLIQSLWLEQPAAATVPKEITTISADRIKSVRTAPLIFSFSKRCKVLLSLNQLLNCASSAVFGFFVL